MRNGTLAVLLVFFVFLETFSQTTSDCTGAISVCDGYYEETSAPIGTGSTIEIPFGSCNPTESNSIWYTFTIQDDGLLSFVIDPGNDNCDYDWGLYDITTNGCEGINSGNSPEVSCNSWGVVGVNGTTGISTANGGSGNSNGPGDLNGPPFNGDLPVTAGSTYALAVLNWSSCSEGYTLDFTTSTATLYDDLAPFIVSVTPNCSGSELIVVFSEPVLTATMALGDFSVTGPNGSYDLSNFIAESGGTASVDDTFIFDMSQVMDDEGDYTFWLEEGAGFVQDLCDNSATGSMDFEVSGVMSFEFLTVPACNGEGGSIEIFDISGGVEPFDIYVDGDPESGLIFEDLEPGTYEITLEDNLDCSLTQDITVENFLLDVDAGTDTIPCTMNFNLEGSSNAGEFLWNFPPEIVLDDPTDPGAFAYATTEGVYNLEAVSTLGSCVVTDYINITFSIPLQPEVISTRASCHAICDGSVDIISNSGNINVFLNDNLAPGTEIHFGGLCAGVYPILATNFAGCTWSGEATVIEPPVLIADFEANPQPTEVPESTILFTNLSVNDSISYWTFGDPILGESFDSSAVFTFPIGVGGIYDVILTVTDGFGCTDSIMKQVIISDNFMVFIPNTFTPDYDGINDVFRANFSYPPVEYSLVIMDRWGEPVFSSNDYLEAWTGNFAGREHFVPNGVYNWRLEVQGNEIDKQTLSGSVVLIR